LTAIRPDMAGDRDRHVTKFSVGIPCHFNRLPLYVWARTSRRYMALNLRFGDRRSARPMADMGSTAPVRARSFRPGLAPISRAFMAAAGAANSSVGGIQPGTRRCAGKSLMNITA
jgi:hypothetical protein